MHLTGPQPHLLGSRSRFFGSHPRPPLRLYRPYRPDTADLSPPGGELLGRRLTVLVAYGDFGHAVVDGRMWTIRHAMEVMHPGDTVYVIEHRPDLLVVNDMPAESDERTSRWRRLRRPRRGVTIAAGRGEV